VVAALQRLGRALAGDDLRAAVAARIDERADLAVVVAHDDQRHADEIDRVIVAGVRDVVDASDEVPHLHEDGVDLALEERVARVALRRQRLGLQERTADGVIRAWIEEVHGHLRNRCGQGR